MTGLPHSPLGIGSRNYRAKIFASEPVFASVTIFLIALTIPTILAMALETRTFLGQNVWIKLLKFETSLTFYLVTLLIFASLLPKHVLQSHKYRLFAFIVGFCIVGETLWVGIAAFFGVASHFNYDNVIMSSVYVVMGAFAVILTSATLVYGIVIGRNKKTDLCHPVKQSIVIGLIMTFITTVIVAGYLSSYGSYLVFVDAQPSKADGFPVMGWAREGGDIRVSHFFATHAMQVIPVIGLLAVKFLKERSAMIAVAAASILYFALIAGTFVQAILGHPFLAWID